MTARPKRGPVDHEINFRGIRIFVGGLAAVTLVVFGLMWGIATFFKGSLVKEDPAPAALAEAREARVPPGPNLQPNPTAELAAFRAAEETSSRSGRGSTGRRASPACPSRARSRSSLPRPPRAAADAATRASAEASP